MKNRIFKITLTLVMLLVMAVPTQAFAAEKCDVQTDLAKNINAGNIYEQIVKYITKAGIPAQPAKLTTQKAQPPAKQMQQTEQTTQKEQAKQTPAAVPAKTTAAPAKPAAAPTETTAAAPATGALGAYEQQVVDLVNKERAAVGLPALKVNVKLAQVAEKKAEDLRDRNYFDHQSPTYGSPFDMMKQFGISYIAAGENIAKGQKTPADVMNGWMNSPGHRANILNANFTEIGVGYVTDSNGTTYWVQHFIRP